MDAKLALYCLPLHLKEAYCSQARCNWSIIQPGKSEQKTWWMCRQVPDEGEPRWKFCMATCVWIESTFAAGLQAVILLHPGSL
eukprot:365055-Chlamydomonas_euryale.AAC.3